MSLGFIRPGLRRGSGKQCNGFEIYLLILKINRGQGVPTAIRPARSLISGRGGRRSPRVGYALSNVIWQPQSGSLTGSAWRRPDTRYPGDNHRLSVIRKSWLPVTPGSRQEKPELRSKLGRPREKNGGGGMSFIIILGLMQILISCNSRVREKNPATANEFWMEEGRWGC